MQVLQKQEMKLGDPRSEAVVLAIFLGNPGSDAAEELAQRLAKESDREEPKTQPKKHKV